MVKGSCLCKKVSWQITGDLEALSHCHCSMCRKAHGAPYATFTKVARKHFEWIRGKSEITRYESSPGLIRGFCQHCGSATPAPETESDIYVPAGGLEGDLGVKADRRIFVGSNAPWYDITDGLPRYEEYPQSEFPVVERGVAESTESGVVRGSCVCGDVQFEMSEPFDIIHNCHCSRCRKARAAAHTTNGFLADTGLKFTSGEEHVKTYLLPEANAFGQAFCEKCGGKVPRHNQARNMYSVPLGSLDDDPGQKPHSHIYIDSKADWDEVTGDLPRFAESARR